MNRFQSYDDFVGEHNAEEVSAYLEELRSVLNNYAQLESRLVELRGEYRLKQKEIRDSESRGSILNRIKTRKKNSTKYEELDRLSREISSLRYDLLQSSEQVFKVGLKIQLIEEVLECTK